MKLKDYFNDQRNIHTSQAEKLELYQKIMLQKYQTTRSKRPILQVRSFVYSFIVIILLAGAYGVYFFNTNSNNRSNGILTKNNIFNGVQADFIAKVVDFNGDFYIEHQGKKIQTSNIKAGDKIFLTEKTDLVFQINNATQAKLIGPAECIIHKIGRDEYRVEVVQGDFVEVQSIPDTQNQKIELAIESITVSQTEANKTTHFQISKENNKHILKNQGSDLLVTTTDKNNETIEQQINNTQQLAIQGNDIELVESKTLASAIKEKNVGQIFSLVNNNTEEENNPEVEELQLTDFEDKKEVINEELLDELKTIVPQEDKLLLSPDQNQTLRTSLNKSFLEGDIQNIFVTRTQGQQKPYDIAVYNLEKKVINLAKTFEIKYAKGSSLENIAKNTETIRKNIEEKYLIPPTYIHNLTTLNQRLNLMQTYEFGSLTTNEAEAKRQEIKNTYQF